MIHVSYAPIDSGSIGPNGEKELFFSTHADFRDWVEYYVCSECSQYAREHEGTVSQWLSSGCGCEIDIDDPDNIIHWDDIILDDEGKKLVG